MYELLLNAVLVSVGIILLYFGATWLVTGSSSLAQRFKINKMVIGLTVVSFATSSPELAVTLSASLSGLSDVTIGNVVGSNIANIGLVLGIFALMKTIPFRKENSKRNVPIMLGSFLLLVVLSIDGSLSWFDGTILVGGIVLFVFFSYKRPYREFEQAAPLKQQVQPVFRSVILILSSIMLLTISSFITVDNAVSLAESLGVSKLIIGITLLAFGTSIPELATNAISIKRGQFDLSIGNIIGSNVFNILAIAGIASVFTEIMVIQETFWNYLVMFVFGFVLFFLSLKESFLSKLEGSLLLGGYISYVVFLVLK